MAPPQGANQRWSLDFLSDAFTDGRRFRILAIVDDFTRECLALIADTSLPGLQVVREFDALIAIRGRPAVIVSDNGTELTSLAILRWKTHRWMKKGAQVSSPVEREACRTGLKEDCLASSRSSHGRCMRIRLIVFTLAAFWTQLAYPFSLFQNTPVQSIDRNSSEMWFAARKSSTARLQAGTAP